MRVLREGAAADAQPNSDSIVDRVYEQTKAMAVLFEFKPGERLNEGDIAKRLGVSRTPLREALNRLTTEGFLRFVPGKGFFCRELDANEIFDLYELRKTIEVAAVQLVVERAQDQDIDSLLSFLDETGPDPGERTTAELVALDETFHERLIAMSGNAEMLRVLHNVNARIRFVRWIDMDRANRVNTQMDHRHILSAVKARDAKACASALERHINRRLDQISGAIKEGYAKIYVPQLRAGVR